MTTLTTIFLTFLFSQQIIGNLLQSKPHEEIGYWELPTGSKIAYFYFQGREPRKPTAIIYLHGGPGGNVTSRDTSVFSKLANDGYDVYLYDQIGGGNSGRLKNIREYTVERQVRDLEAIVELIGVSKIIFIAQSWGASLAPLYLAKHPDRVEKLIFSGPGGMIPKNFNYFTPLPDSVNLKNRGNKPRSFSDLPESAVLKRYNKICNYASFGIKIASDKEADSLLNWLITIQSKNNNNNEVLTDTIKLEVHGGAYSNIRTSLFINKGKDKRKILSNINIPVLILLGESDNLPWGCVADYLHVFKNIKLIVIPKSGHSVFLYQPDLCLKLTRAFLAFPEK
jgi:proline iminopeptidase